jgi:tetratricopeptide (TPR) repeat protein
LRRPVEYNTEEEKRKGGNRRIVPIPTPPPPGRLKKYASYFIIVGERDPDLPSADRFPERLYVKGSLKSETLPAVFRNITASKKSGLLFLKNGQVQKAVYFQAGNIVAAESNVKEDSLGYRLLDMGSIDLETLRESMKQVAPGKTLRAVLLERNLFREEELQEVLRKLVYETIVSCFDWTEGEYSFEEGEFLYGKDLCSDISTPGILIEGVRRMFDFDPIMRELLESNSPVAFAKDPPVSAQRINLEPSEGFILSRIDGNLSPREICAVSMISEEMTCRFIYGLLMAGILELKELTSVKKKPKEEKKPEAAASRGAKDAKKEKFRPAVDRLTPEQKQKIEAIKEKYSVVDSLNYYAILEVAKGVPTYQINQAYEKLEEKFNPERNPFIKDADIWSKLTYVWTKINVAYRTLTSDVERLEYDERLRKEEKEQRTEWRIRMEFMRTEKQMEQMGQEHDALVSYTKARKFFETERYHDAVENCKEAIKLSPNDARFHHLMGKIQAKNPNMRWQKQAERSFQRAIELDPWDSDYVYDLAVLYKDQKMQLKAKKYFIKVLELEPNHAGALAEVPPGERPKVKRIIETADKESGPEDEDVIDPEKL